MSEDGEVISRVEWSRWKQAPLWIKRVKVLSVGRCHRLEGGRGRERVSEGELCTDAKNGEDDNYDVNNDNNVYSDRLSLRGNLII